MNTRALFRNLVWTAIPLTITLLICYAADWHWFAVAVCLLATNLTGFIEGVARGN